LGGKGGTSTEEICLLKGGVPKKTVAGKPFDRGCPKWNRKATGEKLQEPKTLDKCLLHNTRHLHKKLKKRERTTKGRRKPRKTNLEKKTIKVNLRPVGCWQPSTSPSGQKHVSLQKGGLSQGRRTRGKKPEKGGKGDTE